MAFCGSCGAQIADNERFCVKCGADQTAKEGGAAAAVAASAAAPPAKPLSPPPPSAPPAVPPTYAQYPPPGPVPVAPMPQPARAKGHALIWLLILAALGGGGYYYYIHYYKPKHQQAQSQASQQPTSSQQSPQGQPAQQPGPQGQPGQAPSPQGTPVGSPQGANQTLVQQQQFAWQGQPQSGYVMVTQAKWTNGSTVTIQSATLECDQYNAQNQSIGSMQTTLNGPLGPGQTMAFGQFQMGQLATGVANVKCQIVAVNPATQ